MSCNDPTCVGCRFNREVLNETIRNVHLNPGITCLQASSLMASAIIMQAQAYADSGEVHLLKTLGMGKEAAKVELDHIEKYLLEGKNAIHLYAATVQLLAVFADKLDVPLLKGALIGAFAVKDKEFFPEDLEQHSKPELIAEAVDDFVGNYLGSCLERGRQTVEARATNMGVKLGNMVVNEGFPETKH